MSLSRSVRKRAARRAFVVRNSFRSKGKKPRVSVFRSLNHIYAQIINDEQGETIVSYSSLQLDKKTLEQKDKKAIARLIGVELGKKAVEKNVKDVFFDRGRFRYHGRILELAEGLRESGLIF